jgi:hypothetical protein
MASSKDCQHFIREKEIQIIKSEKKNSYPETRLGIWYKNVKAKIIKQTSTTIGALRIVLSIEALVIFLSTLKTFKFSFTLALAMSDFLTLKASYWIRDIWTDFSFR